MGKGRGLLLQFRGMNDSVGHALRCHGGGGGSGGEGGLGGSLVGLFTPRLAARRSQRNRWQRATSLPDGNDVREDGARFFLRGGIWQGLEGVEPPERIITKRYWMLGTGMESVFQYLVRICNLR